MILEIQGLKKSFDTGNGSKRLALDELDLRLEKRDFLVVLGANGSGKSTLLNSLAGSLQVDSGRILLHGKDISKLPAHKRSPWLARVFQDPLAGTAPSLSVLDNFRLAALRDRRKGFRLGNTLAFRKKVQEQIAALEMGLELHLDTPMGKLSGGQRQALTLLMCTMAPLEILLLDEPTAVLDPRSAHMIMQLTSTLIQQHELTVVWITHSIQEALQYGNRLIQMQDGKIHRQFSTQEKRLLRQEDILGWFQYAL